jgi:thiol:disulfide interchange protein DsbD
MNWVADFDGVIRTSPLLAIALAFAGGVLAGFTPCTYPVLPLIVSFIGSKAGGRWARGLLLSSIYVLGMAAVYATLGAVAAVSGRLFGAMTGNPWTYLLVGNVCLLFALVTLEAIPLRSPMFLSRLQVRQMPGHDVVTSLLMGGVSALVISGCTTPILGVLLTLVSTRQDAVWGCAMLFAFSCGLGTPIVLAGTFAGMLTTLPRSGRWLKWIQYLFALLMILTAEYFFIKAGEMWL